MSIDLRVKHDLESRRRAVELFDAGVGCKPAAEALSVPRETVREWQWVYRAFGSEALLSMGGKQSSYTFEQRVAAASAVVDGGMAKADAMAEFGIRSKSPLERWCRLYREGGAEALRPRPKGRPRGSRSKPRARTREQELEERCRRLEAEVAYLGAVVADKTVLKMMREMGIRCGIRQCSTSARRRSWRATYRPRRTSPSSTGCSTGSSRPCC